MQNLLAERKEVLGFLFYGVSDCVPPAIQGRKTKENEEIIIRKKREKGRMCVVLYVRRDIVMNVCGC